MGSTSRCGENDETSGHRGTWKYSKYIQNGKREQGDIASRTWRNAQIQATAPHQVFPHEVANGSGEALVAYLWELEVGSCAQGMHVVCVPGPG